MKRHAIILNGGSIAGIASFIMFLIYYYVLNANPFGAIRLIGVAVPIIVYVYTLRKHREEQLYGYMNFLEAVPTTIIFSFIYASLTAMLVYFFGLLIDSSFVELVREDTLKQIGLTKDFMIDSFGKSTYQQMLDEAENQSLTSIAFADFGNKIISTSIVTMIIAAIMRKPAPSS